MGFDLLLEIGDRVFQVFHFELQGVYLSLNLRIPHHQLDVRV